MFKLKVRSSSLLETLIATILIIIIFGVAGMLLNSAARNMYKNNNHDIQAHCKEIIYLQKQGELKMPIYEEIDSWHIHVNELESNLKNFSQFEILAQTTDSSKTYKKIYYVKKY